MKKEAIEWDAGAYHALSNPQHAWGMAVLQSFDLRGDERAIDAGCGSGRLTAELLSRLPEGHVLAVDRSQNMVEEARRHLGPRFGERVSFLCTDLLELAVPEAERASLIFSTATFHWVLDQASLYRRLFGALAPGGRLVAQYGGGPNLARLRARVDALRAEPPFAASFEGFREPWVYMDAAAVRPHLEAAGFGEIEASVTEAPTLLPDEETYSAFLRRVVLRVHCEQLPEELASRFVAELTAASRGDSVPWSLDYHRLNVRARRPESA